MVDLLTLRDRACIEEAIYRYGRFADAGSPEGMASIFAEDAELLYRGEEGPVTKGRSALIEYLTPGLAAHLACSHHLTGVELQFVDSDTALSHTKLYSWERFIDHPDRPDRHVWGAYEATWRRTDTGWECVRWLRLIAGVTGGDVSGPAIGATRNRIWPPTVGQESG